jgi:hypothetical protein
VGNLRLSTGSGNDNVTFAATSSVNTAKVSLGRGDDTVTFLKGATITTSATFDGGPGTDAFVTTLTAVPANVTLKNFENVVHA